MRLSSGCGARVSAAFFFFLPVLTFALFTGTSRAQAKAAPAPDVIVFTNGDQLTGTLVRGIGNTVIFKSDMAGEITVSLDKVKELHSASRFAVLTKDVPVTNKPVATGALTFSANKLTVDGVSAASSSTTVAAQSVAPDKIAYILDEKTYDREMARTASFFEGWNGSVSGGATIVQATNYGETFTAGIALARLIPTVPFLPARNRTTFNLIETYGKLTQPVIPQTTPASPASVAITSIFHTDAERDEYFSARFYALAEVSFDHNFAQGLNLQQVYGTGAGWTPIKKANQQLDVKADVHYEKQAFQTPGSNQNLIGSTFAEAYRRNLPRKVVLTQTVSILPAFNNPSAFSANGSIALALPLFKRLGMSVTTSDNYLNNPAVGFDKNSYQFVTGVSYTLR